MDRMGPTILTHAASLRLTNAAAKSVAFCSSLSVVSTIRASAMKSSSGCLYQVTALAEQRPANGLQHRLGTGRRVCDESYGHARGFQLSQPASQLNGELGSSRGLRLPFAC